MEIGTSRYFKGAYLAHSHDLVLAFAVIHVDGERKRSELANTDYNQSSPIRDDGKILTTVCTFHRAMQQE